MNDENLKILDLNFQVIITKNINADFFFSDHKSLMTQKYSKISDQI